MTDQPLRIGTRGSPLALWQAEHVERLLSAAGHATDVVPIKTTGDKVTDRPLAEIGGKGLFTKELDLALADGRIDLAVHCVKDMETMIAPEMAFPAILPREDPRDALMTRMGRGLDGLPEGAVIGTTSLRRQAQLLAYRPDLKMTLFRGNVHTRLNKMVAGSADATLLAVAGLTRLEMTDSITEVLTVDVMLPAVGQGALAIACRADDQATAEALAPFDDSKARAEITAERAMLATLDGSCRTPIAGLAWHEGGQLHLRGLVAEADGSAVWRGERQGPVRDAEAIGNDLGQDLRQQAGEDFFRRLAT